MDRRRGEEESDGPGAGKSALLKSTARLRSALRRAAIALAPRFFLRAVEPDGGELGRLGEELAARHLAGRGWRILGRRVPTPCGEVDLWAERAGVLACVEVKTGRLPENVSGGIDGARFRPGHRVDARRLRRLQRAARFLARGAPARIDLIEVAADERGRTVRIVHHEDLRSPLPGRGRLPRFPTSNP